MVATLQSIQIILSLVLIVLVLLQRPQTDASSAPVGGDGGSFIHTRRGAERFFYVLTIITAILFAGVSLAVVVML